MSRLPSSIRIRIDGVNVTDQVLFRETSFTMSANPIQGSFRVAIKDVGQDFEPVAGQKMTCEIDDNPLFGGYIMQIGRGIFFPVADTSSPGQVARKWTLSGPDYNVLFDKRVLHDPSDHTAFLEVPSDKLNIGEAFTYLMNHYIDVPSGLDYTTHADDIRIKYGDRTHGGGYVGQGKTWREQMEDFMDHGGVIYYIDADFNVHLHTYESQEVPWFFTDYRPNGTTTVGFREGEYLQDMSQIITEALVWGGSSIKASDGGTEGDIVFAKYPTSPASSMTVWDGEDEEQTFTAAKEQQALDRRSQYGRWQMAEEHAGQNNYLSQDSVRSRAYTIINGPAGAVPTYGEEGGFGKPLPTMRASWFAHDVPGTPGTREHIRAGYLVGFTLYTQNINFTLPCRSLNISFPTLPSDPEYAGDTWVRFDGEFGISHSDRRYLWKAMRRAGRPRMTAEPTVLVDDSSETIPPHSLGTFSPFEPPDGVTTDFTFQTSTGTQVIFMVNEFDVFINGLTQRGGIDYTYDATTGTVSFIVAPASDDQLSVTGSVGSGAIVPPTPPPPTIGGLPAISNPLVYEPLISATMPSYLGTPHLCTHQSGTTEIARVSDVSGRRNNYSSSCAWNYDMSMLNLGYSSAAIVDGSTYGVLNASGISSYAFALSWSHVDPNLGFVRANQTSRALEKVSVSSAGVIAVLQTVTAASLGHVEAAFGAFQGEQDNNDQYFGYAWRDSNGDYGIGVWDLVGWAVHAERTMGNTGGSLSAIIDHTFTSQSGQWMSVTFEPDGTGFTEGMWAYEVDLNTTTRRQIATAQQHGDWAQTSLGDDRFVRWEYEGIHSFNPVTGGVVDMGPSSVPGDSHVSGRSVQAPGLVYVSQNSASQTNPGFGEIFALTVDDPDPSDAYVFGFTHRTQDLGYDSFLFACPTPDGRRVTCGLPWESSSSVYAYVMGVDTGL